MAPQTAVDLPSLSPLPKKPGAFQSASFNPGPSLPGLDAPDSNPPEDAGWSDQSLAFNTPPVSENVNAPVDYSAAQPSEEAAEPVVASPKPAPILGKSKEELEAELDSLENKLNSFRDLRSFVDKKLESGKINQSNYDKQIKKLESDINKTKYRMDEIRQQLSKM